MKLQSLDDVFRDELADLLSAERQLLEVFPKIAEAAHAVELRAALEDHWETTRYHLFRLENIFQTLGQKPPDKLCKAMKGLIEETEELLRSSVKCAARDAAIIGACQRVEHYEMAGYGTARSHAATLGLSQAEASLNETLNEEREANLRLNDIAKTTINVEAVH